MLWALAVQLALSFGVRGQGCAICRSLQGPRYPNLGYLPNTNSHNLYRNPTPPYLWVLCGTYQKGSVREALYLRPRGTSGCACFAFQPSLPGEVGVLDGLRGSVLFGFAGFGHQRACIDYHLTSLDAPKLVQSAVQLQCIYIHIPYIYTYIHLIYIYMTMWQALKRTTLAPPTGG